MPASSSTLVTERPPATTAPWPAKKGSSSTRKCAFSLTTTERGSLGSDSVCVTKKGRSSTRKRAFSLTITERCSLVSDFVCVTHAGFIVVTAGVVLIY